MIDSAITASVAAQSGYKIKPIAERLGIPEVGWQLRHWNTTAMDEEGFSTKVRQTRVGHASPIVTNE